MKTLLILRHAKSSWKDAGLADHDRPLNKRGKRAAPRMGELIQELKLIPEQIVSSTAERARDTADRVAKACSFGGEIDSTDSLYLAHPEDILTVLQSVDDAVRRVMVVGHNPGLEQLVELLTGQYSRLPTAALARVDITIGSWSQLDSDSPASLVNLWLPRELE